MYLERDNNIYIFLNSLYPGIFKFTGELGENGFAIFWILF